MIGKKVLKLLSIAYIVIAGTPLMSSTGENGAQIIKIKPSWFSTVIEVFPSRETILKQKAAAIAASVLLIAAPIVRHITDGKKANEKNELETQSIRELLLRIRSTPTDSVLYKELVKILYAKFGRFLRNAGLGHRSYKVTLRENKREQQIKDRQEKVVTTEKEEKVIDATGLCKTLESAFENANSLANLAALYVLFTNIMNLKVEDIAKVGKLV